MWENNQIHILRWNYEVFPLNTIYREILIDALDKASANDSLGTHHTEDLKQRLKDGGLTANQLSENLEAMNYCFWEEFQKNEASRESLSVGEERKEAKNLKGDPSWVPQSLFSSGMAMSNNTKDNDFIRYRLNNPRITKRGDNEVPETMWNAYFEQRRNVLTQLLQSYNDDDIVIHQLIKKSITKRRRVGAIGSKYRGVSRNKNKWQVMIMGNFKKFYIGGIKTELEAAKLYDKLAIFYHGIEAKTNFQYIKRQIEALIAEPIDPQIT